MTTLTIYSSRYTVRSHPPPSPVNKPAKTYGIFAGAGGAFCRWKFAIEFFLRYGINCCEVKFYDCKLLQSYSVAHSDLYVYLVFIEQLFLGHGGAGFQILVSPYPLRLSVMHFALSDNGAVSLLSCVYF